MFPQMTQAKAKSSNKFKFFRIMAIVDRDLYRLLI